MNNGDNENESERIVLTVIELFITYMKRVRDLFHLATLEAKLALKSLIIIAVIGFIMGTLLTSLWVSLSALLFLYLQALHFSVLGAGAIVVAVNFISLLTLFAIIYRLKDNLFFHGTCSQLNIDYSTEDEHERIAP